MMKMSNELIKEPVKRAGQYKHTEVGLIPEDWELKSYGDVFSFLKTANYSRAEIQEVGPVGYIHYGDIHTKFHFKLDVTSKKLPAIGLGQSTGKSLVTEGDVVMADASEDYSGIGKSVELLNVGDAKIVCGLHTFLLRDAGKAFVNGFRGYLHSIGFVKMQIDRLATGMKVYGVSKNNLRQVLIPIPPKKEQTAIAYALSDADALIASLEKLIEKKKKIKQGAMQELLRPKEGWVKKKLGEVLQVKHGKDQKRVISESDGKYPILGTSGEIGLSKDYLWNKPSVLIGRKGTIDKPQFMGQPFWTIDTLFFTDIFAGYDAKFIYYRFQLVPWLAFNEASGVPSLSAKTIESIEVWLPEFSEQVRISGIITDIENEIKLVASKLDKARFIKEGMMQSLLTGRIRLV